MNNTPTDGVKNRVINVISEKLNDPRSDLPENAQAKEGLLEARQIIMSGKTDYDGLERLSGAQSRAIACLAVDFLNGTCEDKFFIDFPLK